MLSLRQVLLRVTFQEKILQPLCSVNAAGISKCPSEHESPGGRSCGRSISVGPDQQLPQPCLVSGSHTPPGASVKQPLLTCAKPPARAVGCQGFSSTRRSSLTFLNFFIFSAGSHLIGSCKRKPPRLPTSARCCPVPLTSEPVFQGFSTR